MQIIVFCQDEERHKIWAASFSKVWKVTCQRPIEIPEIISEIERKYKLFQGLKSCLTKKKESEL